MHIIIQLKKFNKTCKSISNSKFKYAIFRTSIVIRAYSSVKNKNYVRKKLSNKTFQY